MIKFKKIFIILFSIIYLLIAPSYSASGIKDFEKIDLSKDQKPGRYFEDQPDITDEHQIHFIYLLPADAEDGELDINGIIISQLKKRML